MDSSLAGYIARLPASFDGNCASASDAPHFDVPLRQRLDALGVRRRILALVGAHAAETAFIVVGWGCIGTGALSGRLEPGWLIAWALCAASTLLLRATGQWLAGLIAIAISGALRETLLAGATAIDPDVIRRKGVGELLCEVLEIEQIERLAPGGGIAALLALIELAVALWVLASVADAPLQAAALVAWLVIALALLTHNTRARHVWTAMRFELTRTWVENLIAHRTRAVQQPLSERHASEDRDHERYAQTSRTLDRSTVMLNTLPARGYIATALIALAPVLVNGRSTLVEQTATLGGILLAAAALKRLTSGCVSIATAWIAMRQMRPLIQHANPTPQPNARFDDRDLDADLHTTEPVLRAEELGFTHAGRNDPTLRACTLVLRRGEFVLLEGESGAGKSTFAAVLAGLRRPHSGTILSGGLDQQAWGRDWRRRVVWAPPCHENHVLAAPLSFNLLLGRPLPHSPADMQEAQAVCQELGLGPLLARMPAGLHQMVGETGWQLSQGERARVFLARTLLQNSQVVVLDESFAALDPENLLRCLHCLRQRARTVLMIAHP